MTNGNFKHALIGSSLIAIMQVSGALAAQDSQPLISDVKASVSANARELAAFNRGSAAETLASFLGGRGHSINSIQSSVSVADYYDKQGRRFASFEQQIDGVRIFGAYAKIAFGPDNQLIHAIERFADVDTTVNLAFIGEEEALAAALAEHFPSQGEAPGRSGSSNGKSFFDKGSFFHSEPSVEPIILARGARGKGGLSQGFLVETWSESDNLLYHTVVDGRGRVVSSELRTAEDSYNVFAVDPSRGGQTVIAGPGAGNAESPSGWLSGAQASKLIQGNNVSAYLDVDNNNGPDAPGTTITDGNFLTSVDLTQDPSTTQNQEVAVQNLFYLSNVIHDRLYRHGFVEATRNFQENNFGNGGSGSDSVNAEAQDGGSLNNANFATPSDGSNPRMQMYLWDLTSPRRDGDLDSDIVWHEYGHGLTWRMIGSMSGDISGAIGEGMSDTLSIIINGDDAVGEYSLNRANGIRSSRYSVHPDTIGDFDAARGVHRNGEIYGATMWTLLQSYLANGYSQDDILDDLVGGMNFTPAGPDYFDMRDGILASAPAERTCLVWEAFAGKGMGEGGSMGTKGRRITVTESFTVPDVCNGDTPPPPPPPAEVDAALIGLSGSSSNQGQNRWRATATASVEDSATGGAGANVTVTGTWSTGDAGSCTTDSTGQCSITLSGLRLNRDQSVSFTVTSLDGNNGAAGVPQTVTINRP